MSIEVEFQNLKSKESLSIVFLPLLVFQRDKTKFVTQSIISVGFLWYGVSISWEKRNQQ